MSASTGLEGSCYAKPVLGRVGSVMALFDAPQPLPVAPTPPALQSFAMATHAEEAVVTNDYTLIGHGRCLDGAQQSYEYWYLDGLTYENGDRSTCACEACRGVCDQHEGCVGYEFFCCPA